MRQSLILLLLFFFSALSYGQQEGETEEIYEETYEETYEDFTIETMIEFSFNPIFPVLTMKEQIGSFKGGASLSVYRRFKERDNLWYGLSLNYWRLDRLTNTFIVSDTFEDFEVEATTVSNNVNAEGRVRYYTDFYTPRLEPYVELGLGIHHVFTRTSELIEGEESPTLNFNGGDTALSYSAGIGLQINISQNVATHIATHYVGGGSASYNVAGAGDSLMPFDNFERRTTQIEYIQGRIGVTIGF